MIENNNKAVIKKMTNRSIKANKTRNIFVILAIVLTTFMISSVFSIGFSFVKNYQTSMIRTNGTTAGVKLDKPTNKQINDLKNPKLGMDINISYKLNGKVYTTAEPCAMYSGAIYWANIGRVVYGMTERRLLELTGSNEQNPTFDLPCRDVFSRGQKDIQVIGPIEAVEVEVEVEAAKVHEGYWD